MRRIAITLLAGAALAASATRPGQAQNDFNDNGSFSDGGSQSAGASTAAEPAAEGGGGDSFAAGSFDSGNFEAGQTTEGPPQEASDFADPEGVSDAQAETDVTPPPPADLLQPPSPPPAQQADVPKVPSEILAFESRDFGVQPTGQLRLSQFHAPTPLTIAGANVVTTQRLVEAYAKGIDMVVVDVLGGQYMLPGAISAPAMAQGGSFSDAIQHQTGQWLGQRTGGNADAPIIIYCSDPMCWLSYNAVLRATAAGYTNVHWYRGGIQAWQMAGLKVVASGF